MKESLKALHNSVAHLGEVVEKIDSEDYTKPAYPAKWSISDTLSHVGSGAVIMSQNFDNVVSGNEADPTFNQSVWDEWNAKEPSAQVADALVADNALLDRLQMLDEAGRESFGFSMGPMNLDFDAFVALRLQEQALHTWDVEVTSNASVTLPEDAVTVMVDRLAMFVGFSGKASGEVKEVRVTTVNPERAFVLSFAETSLSLAPNEHGGNVDLELPAESFVRLVSGRLDPQHTPHGLIDPLLDELRQAFPGY
ncbi:MAG: maleylpyruvate isomerase family mycothiol-dependent enzyme [Acidimicrobiales bacterium]